MFNAEKLLGKIVQETLTGGGSGSKKGGGLFDSLTSGAGLMTAIGLGVGAFEILKEQKEKAPSGAPSHSPPPPPTPSGGNQAPPPPPAPPHPPAQLGERGAEALSGQDLALRMIQVMIGAAHADGVLDESEEKAILDRLKAADLDSEEKMFLVSELHRPKDLAELTAGIDDPGAAKTMYMLAVATIEVDTDAERAWLDELGDRLRLSSEIRSFLEEQVG